MISNLSIIYYLLIKRSMESCGGNRMPTTLETNYRVQRHTFEKCALIKIFIFLRMAKFFYPHSSPSSSVPPAASCASWDRGGGGCPRASSPGCWSSSQESDGSLAPAINMVYKQILPNNDWQANRTCRGVSLSDFCKVADRQLGDRTVLLGLFNCKQMVSK